MGMGKGQQSRRIYAIMTSLILIVGTLTLSIPPQEAYATSISDCTGDSSVDRERLILTGDIIDATVGGLGECILIVHDNVTLDCKGFTIDGTNEGISTGVKVFAKNVTIKNCNITDFFRGITLSASDGGTITRNTLSSNINAITLSGGSDDNRITSNTVTSNGNRALTIIESSFNTVARNNFDGNGGDGIRLIDAASNNIQANSLDNNSFGLRLLGNSDFNTIKRNTANSNTSDGFNISSDSDSNTFTANTANDNTDDGIDDNTGATAALVTNTYKRNTCSNNGGSDSEPPGLCS